MTIMARVHNHSIALPVDMEIPEGTQVQVTLPERLTSGPVTGPLDWMAEFVGALDTLPAEAAEQHTELSRGKKRGLG